MMMKSILVIDDDAAILNLFTQYLESRGYRVRQAPDGRKGLKALEAEPTDLVITDIMMPETDGLEMIQTIRKSRPGLPVIAISGGMRNATISFLPHARTFGADRVFEKPVPLAELLAAVQELLGESEPG
jgi:DNA-binding response OmpR family regulator